MVKKNNTDSKKGKTNKTKTKKIKKENYFVGVKREMAKVKWPSKNDVVKYTIATIIFIIVLVIFFILMSLIMSLIKGVFN